MKYNYLKIAEIIKEKRLESGMSQRQLGLVSGISHTEISTIEKGMKMNYSLLMLIKLCEVLDIDFTELLRESGYLEDNTIKKYRVLAQSKKEEYYFIKAKSANEVYKNVLEFIRKNKIFGNDNVGALTFNVVETNEDFTDELDISELLEENLDDEEEEYDVFFV